MSYKLNNIYILIGHAKFFFPKKSFYLTSVDGSKNLSGIWELFDGKDIALLSLFCSLLFNLSINFPVFLAVANKLAID